MNPWGQPAFEGVSHNRTRTLAIHLNCNYDIRDTEWHETMNCLRRLSAKALTVAFYELYVSIKFIIFCWKFNFL